MIPGDPQSLGDKLQDIETYPSHAECRVCLQDREGIRGKQRLDGRYLKTRYPNPLYPYPQT